MNDPGWGRDKNQDSNQGNDDRDRRNRPGNDDGPPDLDELWRDMNRRLNSFFGRDGGGGSGGGTGGGGPSMKGALIGLLLLSIIGLAIWAVSGVYIIREGESSIELKFGSFSKQKDQAGLTWRLPTPFETHEIVNVEQLRTVEIGFRGELRNKNLNESLMLTSDRSIVDIQFAIQFRVGDPKAYLFNNRLGNVPEDVVRQAGEAAMREVVGRSLIDRVLFAEKEQVGNEAEKLAQRVLDLYGVGITLVDVTVQQVQPPGQVQEAFADANRAGQDKKRLVNEGLAYRARVIPIAQGNAVRVDQEAQAYRSAAVAQADGDSQRFSALLEEYRRAPKVTRDRLYLETMESVFKNTSKLYMDSNKSNNMMYMPLDKLIQPGQTQSAPNSVREEVGRITERVKSATSQSNAGGRDTGGISRDRNAPR